MRIVGIVVVLSILIANAASGAPRSDIVVYGDHVPTYTRDGIPHFFANPFTERDEPDDPDTRVLVEPVSGVRSPIGTVTWSIEAFGKYVFVGNYDEGHAGVGENIEDHRVGVFDTETKTFCELDMNPAAVVNSSAEWIVTTNPTARQSRILVQGFGDAPLGYIDADLDNSNPCDPVSGWHVHTFSSADLNAAAPTLPVDRKPCGLVFGVPSCSLDGMALLRHDDVTGADTFVLHEYFAKRIVVGDINAAGALSITDVYVTPLWKPAAGNGACFTIQPVSSPSIDNTRPVADQRFASGFDMVCDVPDGTPGCTPWVPLCPGTGTSCTPGSTCPKKVCTNGYTDCQTNNDCPFSSCTDACQLVHPGSICSVTSSQHCARNDDCPTGETCICGPGRPFQEFRFNGTAITPTSAQVQTAAGYNMGALAASYDTAGELWVSEAPANYSTPTRWAVYGKDGVTGEHSYFTTSDPAGSEIWPATASFPFEPTHGSFGIPTALQPLGNATYAVGYASTLQLQKRGPCRGGSAWWAAS